jgi:hypothetical protein
MLTSMPIRDMRLGKVANVLHALGASNGRVIAVRAQHFRAQYRSPMSRLFAKEIRDLRGNEIPEFSIRSVVRQVAIICSLRHLV